MPLNKPQKILSLSNHILELDHHKQHTSLLQQHFTNLEVASNTDGSVSFYTKDINPSTNDLSVSTYTNGSSVYGTKIYCVEPFAFIKVNCDMCDGLLKVHAMPYKIPIYTQIGSDYGTDEHEIFCFAYEDICTQYNISDAVVKKINTTIVDAITAYRIPNTSIKSKEINTSFVNASIKKLLLLK